MSTEQLIIDWLGGWAPVQAEGTVAGHAFYFRARHQHWTFAISEHAHVAPVSMSSSEAGEAYGYFAEAVYGDEEFAASWMDHDEARRIIERCAAEYLTRRTA
jgi:hypothetical protein